MRQYLENSKWYVQMLLFVANRSLMRFRLAPTGWAKKLSHIVLSIGYLHQIGLLTDFQNFFTCTFRGKFVINWLLSIPPHLVHLRLNKIGKKLFYKTGLSFCISIYCYYGDFWKFIFHKVVSGAFLAAAVWGGQWGGHIFIWGAKNFGWHTV